MPYIESYTLNEEDGEFVKRYEVYAEVYRLLNMSIAENYNRFRLVLMCFLMKPLYDFV